VLCWMSFQGMNPLATFGHRSAVQARRHNGWPVVSIQAAFTQLWVSLERLTYSSVENLREPYSYLISTALVRVIVTGHHDYFLGTRRLRSTNQWKVNFSKAGPAEPPLCSSRISTKRFPSGATSQFHRPVNKSSV
jgi:hypothetical protein